MAKTVHIYFAYLVNILLRFKKNRKYAWSFDLLEFIFTLDK